MSLQTAMILTETVVIGYASATAAAVDKRILALSIKILCIAGL